MRLMLFAAVPDSHLPRTAKGVVLTRTLCAALALSFVVAWLPETARAVQVSITYNITGSTGNSTPFLGGATPTGGSATIVWSMTSINGYPHRALLSHPLLERADL